MATIGLDKLYYAPITAGTGGAETYGTPVQLAKAINYATPNKASLEIMDDDFKNNRVINPNKQEINRMVFLTDLGEAEKYFDEAWMIVKTK